MTTDALPILTTPVKEGGFGRFLTAEECRLLREATGIRCSRRWIVVRQVTNSNLLGVAYRPVNGRYHQASRLGEDRPLWLAVKA